MYREIRGRDSWIWVCFDSRRYKTWAVVPKKKENQLKQTKKNRKTLLEQKKKWVLENLQSRSNEHGLQTYNFILLTELKKQEANFSGASSHFSSSLQNLLWTEKENTKLKRQVHLFFNHAEIRTHVLCQS